eukprot:scpid92922/ scgid25747/ 
MYRRREQRDQRRMSEVLLLLVACVEPESAQSALAAFAQQGLILVISHQPTDRQVISKQLLAARMESVRLHGWLCSETQHGVYSLTQKARISCSSPSGDESDSGYVRKMRLQFSMHFTIPSESQPLEAGPTTLRLSSNAQTATQLRFNLKLHNQHGVLLIPATAATPSCPGQPLLHSTLKCS